MPEKKLTAQWREEPVVPGSWEDVGALVALARKARKQLVDFDWLLTHDEITRLREAVHNWGVHVRGRYKKFDAQVLAAINEVLEEPDSAHTLPIPKKTEWAKSEVRAAREGNDFRLTGHAGFDVVFGYAWVDLEPDKADVRLGLDLSQKLGDLADQLGWGVSKLERPELQPVVNVLFGFSPTHEVKPPPGDAPTPTETLDLTLHGPLYWNTQCGLPSLFEPPLSLEKGIYLWAFHADGQDRVHYVGQTRRSFASRTSEHLSSYLSGNYSIIDVEQLAHGRQRQVWKGTYAGQDYGQSLAEFLERHDEIMPKLRLLLDRLRFYVVPLERDKRLFDRVEGKLGRHFLNHPDDEVRKSFVVGAKFPSAIPFDKTARCVIKSRGPISGLPTELIV